MKVEGAYQDILDKQLSYNVQLAGNDDFLNWTWSDMENGTKKPKISKQMLETFGEGAESLEEIQQVDAAIEVLYQWRTKLGLESSIMFKLLSVQPSEYSMCHENT